MRRFKVRRRRGFARIQDDMNAIAPHAHRADTGATRTLRAIANPMTRRVYATKRRGASQYGQGFTALAQ